MKRLDSHPLGAAILGVVGLTLGFALATQAEQEPWTLERTLEYAMGHNPDTRIAQRRLQAAEAGLEQANAAFWPRLQFLSSYTRTDSPMQAFGTILNQRSFTPSLPFNRVPDVDNLNLKGLLTVPLYEGGRIKAGRESARARSEMARRQDEAVRNAIGFEVVRSFQTILKTRAFVRATESAVHSLEQNGSIAKRRFEVGTLLKSDVLDLEVRLAQSREELVRARNANVLAVRALRNLLGLENGEFGVAETAPTVSVPESRDVSRRPELAVARERERLAEAELRSARGGYLPRVSAVGSLDHDRGWVLNGEGNSYTAGVVMQWDLWDGFATRAKAREAMANLEAAQEEHRKIQLALELEMEQAQLDLSAAQERLEVTARSVELAEESAKLIRDRFEQGLAFATQLLDAETALVVARVRRAESESDQRIAVAALRKASGMPQCDSLPISPKP